MEPLHDDCFISCNGFKYEAGREGKHLGTFIEFDDALNCINERQKADGWFYDIWFINDHGNLELIDHKGRVIQSWV
jgi:hypothetical protein